MNKEMTEFKIDINSTNYKKGIGCESQEYKKKGIFGTHIHIKETKNFKTL